MCNEQIDDLKIIFLSLVKREKVHQTPDEDRSQMLIQIDHALVVMLLKMYGILLDT